MDHTCCRNVFGILFHGLGIILRLIATILALSSTLFAQGNSAFIVSEINISTLQLTAGDRAGNLFIGNIPSQNLIKIDTHEGMVTDILMESNGNTFICVDQGGNLIRWNYKGVELLRRPKEKFSLYVVTYNNKFENKLIYAGQEGCIYVCDPASLILQSYYELGSIPITKIKFPKYGIGNAAVSFLNRKHQFLDLDSYSFQMNFSMGSKTSINSMAYSNDGQYLYVASDRSKIDIVDTKTAKVTKKMKGHSDRVLAITLSDHNYMLSGSSDSTVIIWDLNKKKKLLQSNLLGGEVISVFFDDDRDLIYAVTDTRIVQVLDRITLRQKFSIFFDDVELVIGQQAKDMWILSKNITHPFISNGGKEVVINASVQKDLKSILVK